MKKQLLAGVLFVAGMTVSFHLPACTGIGLKAKDGGYVMARTMEWAAKSYSRGSFQPRD